MSRPLLDRLPLLVCLLGLSLGCASIQPRAVSYEFFRTPTPDDPWTAKIATWQTRERVSRSMPWVAASLPQPAHAEALASPQPTLRAKYSAFRAERKRALARDLVAWLQGQARQHYIPDGPIDHWATLEETLVKDGEDCDGLELLSYHFLRELGFGEDEVYRAIVYRPEDGQHHMVTLWFEDPDDPWVLDPTGAMTSGMPHLSEATGWKPLKVFSESEEYTAQRRSSAGESQVASAH